MKNFFDELKQTIKNQTQKPQGVVSNLHGVVETVVVPITQPTPQTWYALSADATALPTLSAFVDAYSYGRLPIVDLTAIRGITQYPASGTLPNKRATALFTALNAAGPQAFPLTLTASGSAVAVYVDGAQVASGQGGVSATIRVTSGHHDLVILAWGGAQPLTVTVPETVALTKAEPVPAPPVLSDLPVSSYLKAGNGSYVVDFSWHNDPYASAWQVYRATTTDRGAIASVTLTETHATVHFDADLSAVPLGTRFLTAAFAAGPIVSMTPTLDANGVVTATDFEVELGSAPTDPASWAGHHFFQASARFASIGHVTYGGDPVIRFRDTSVQEQAVYLYKVTAFGFITGTAESDFSETGWVYIKDQDPPGSITFNPATDLTIQNGEIYLTFTAPVDADYKGVQVYVEDQNDPTIQTLLATELGSPGQADALAFRPPRAGRYWFRSFDWANNVQGVGAGVDFDFDGDGVYLTSMVSSVDLTFDETNDTLYLAGVGGSHCQSAALVLSTDETFATIVASANVSLSPGQRYVLTRAIVSGDRNKRWYGKVTGYGGPLVSGSPTGTVGTPVQDSVFIAPLEVTTDPKAAIDVITDASGNITLLVNAIQSTQSFGYTKSTSGYDFTQANQTLVNFAGASAKQVALGTIAAGQTEYVVVWVYELADGGGVVGGPLSDSVTYGSAGAPAFDYIMQALDGSIQNEIRVDVQIRIVDPANKGGTLSVWVNKDGTASADPTTAADATLAVAATPYVVASSNFAAFDNVRGNAAQDKYIYAEFVNSSGKSTGKVAIKVTTHLLAFGVDGALLPGSVGLTAFAAGLKPVQVVSSLPGTGTDGDVVFLTTDKKLYRWDGTGWSAKVVVSDLAGQIVGTQIADGAIATEHMTANTIDGSVIAAGTMNADRLVANSITAGQIQVGAISSDQIATNAILAKHVLAGTIDATKLNITQLSDIKIPGSGGQPVGLGIIVDGKLQDPSGTRYMNLGATGTSPFLKHDHLSLNADGTAWFDGPVRVLTTVDAVAPPPSGLRILRDDTMAEYGSITGKIYNLYDTNHAVVGTVKQMLLTVDGTDVAVVQSNQLTVNTDLWATQKIKIANAGGWEIRYNSSTGDLEFWFNSIKQLYFTDQGKLMTRLGTGTF